MIRLVLCDMDNTLLPFGWEHVSGRTVSAIHACLGAGIAIGPASGRSRAELASFFRGDEACYATGVLANGQEVYHQGRLIFQKHLDADALRRAEGLVATLPRHLIVKYRDDAFGDWAGMSRDEMGPMYDRAFIYGGERHDRLPDYPATKAGIMCPPDPAATRELVARLSSLCPELDFANTVPGWLDIVARGWSKASGIEVLVRELGISADEVCVFGDAENDLAMFGLIPNACAVANATDAAKRAARWQVGASADDGVAAALERLAAGEPIGQWAVPAAKGDSPQMARLTPSH